MGSLSPWHWFILLVVMVVLFGAKRLPDLARSLGQAKRELATVEADPTAERTV